MTNYIPISLTSVICKHMEATNAATSLGYLVLPNYSSAWIIGQTCWIKVTVWIQYIWTSQKRLIVYRMRDCWRKRKATGYGETS